MCDENEPRGDEATDIEQHDQRRAKTVPQTTKKTGLTDMNVQHRTLRSVTCCSGTLRKQVLRTTGLRWFHQKCADEVARRRARRCTRRHRRAVHVPSTAHSARKAVAGFTRVALRAGVKQAASITTTSSATTPTKGVNRISARPGTVPRRILHRIQPPAEPRTMPVRTSRIPSRSTSAST